MFLKEGDSSARFSHAVTFGVLFCKCLGALQRKMLFIPPRTVTCICYSYGSQNVSLDFSVIADSCLSKLLYLPLEGLSDPSECPFFEPD